MNQLPKALRSLVEAIPPLDTGAMDAARRRNAELTKPPGSLGCLEELAIRLAGMRGETRPALHHRTVILGAADHGVVDAGVTAYPQAVTRQMVANITNGGAAISVLARQAGARLVVIDFGVAGQPFDSEGVVDRRIGPGTANFLQGPAMSRDQAAAAILAGAEALDFEAVRGLDVVATGEMGIGNTTAAAAITAALLGAAARDVTGRGTGIDDAGLEHKIAVIEQSLARHRPDPADPLGVLSSVGGFEVAGLAGVMLAAGSRRIPVVVDGFICGAAALVAARLSPRLPGYLIQSHCSVEPGHALVLGELGLEPLFDLSLRLGEGSGAALAMPMVVSASALHDEMATFAEAGVSPSTHP